MNQTPDYNLPQWGQQTASCGSVLTAQYRALMRPHYGRRTDCVSIYGESTGSDGTGDTPPISEPQSADCGNAFDAFLMLYQTERLKIGVTDWTI